MSPKRPPVDDLDAIRRLFTPTYDDGTTAQYQHDHDAEVAAYQADPRPDVQNKALITALLAQPHLRHRDNPYWDETANLVMEYFELQAGVRYSETLRERFIRWLKRSPAERRLYADGGDMQRAGLVDWFLKMAR
jgi:hypothetical protein